MQSRTSEEKMRQSNGVRTGWPLANEGGRHRPESPSRGVGEVVAAAFHADEADLRGASRGEANVALARQVVVYLLHTRFGMSYSTAGACFARDRTTAAHACRKIEERREDVRFDTLIDCLERALAAAPGAIAR
jgi:chromosomal replication initiation ATPase DnaA